MMSIVKVIVSFLLVVVSRATCSVLAPLAPAVAPVAYTRVTPYNIPPFATSVNIFNKALSVPVPAYVTPFASGVIPPVLATPFTHALPAPFAPAVAAPFASTVPAPYAPAIPAPLAPAFSVPGRSVHAVAPAFLPDAAIPVTAPAAFPGPVAIANAYSPSLPGPPLVPSSPPLYAPAYPGHAPISQVIPAHPGTLYAR